MHLNLLKIKELIKLQQINDPEIIRWLISEFANLQWLQELLYMLLEKQFYEVFCQDELTDKILKMKVGDALFNFYLAKDNHEMQKEFYNLFIERYTLIRSNTDVMDKPELWNMTKIFVQQKLGYWDKKQMDDFKSSLSYKFKENIHEGNLIKKLKICKIEYFLEKIREKTQILDTDKALNLLEISKDNLSLESLTKKYEYLRMQTASEFCWASVFKISELQGTLFMIEYAYSVIFLNLFYNKQISQELDYNIDTQDNVKSNSLFLRKIIDVENQDIENIKYKRLPLEKMKTWWENLPKDEKKILCDQLSIKTNIWGRYKPDDNELAEVYKQKNRLLAKEQSKKYEEIKIIRDRFFEKNKNLEPALFQKQYYIYAAPYTELVLIPEATFEMGSDTTERGRTYNEYLHKVKISSFYIAKYAVSQKLWTAVMGDIYKSKFVGDNLPIENINWYDAIMFCNEYSKICGYIPYYEIDKNLKDDNNKAETDFFKWTVKIIPTSDGFRLPTEAEWEFACLGYSKTPFNSGDTIKTDKANFNGLQPYYDDEKSFDWNRTVPVDNYVTYGFGLHNIHGNVSEWCWDWFGEYQFTPGEVTENPTGAVYGEYRITRGGSYLSAAQNIRTASRSIASPIQRHSSHGMRVARNIPKNLNTDSKTFSIFL